MKIRTRKAPARTASGGISHHEIVRLRYMRYQSSADGTSVFTICQTAREVEGCWYLATISFQTAGSDCDFFWIGSLILALWWFCPQPHSPMNLPRPNLPRFF